MFRLDQSKAFSLTLIDEVGGAQECRALGEEWFMQNHLEAAMATIRASTLKNPL